MKLERELAQARLNKFNADGKTVADLGKAEKARVESVAKKIQTDGEYVKKWQKS